MTSALYAGTVSHVRLRPVRHRLSYRVAQGLFDLDELPALGRRLRLFGYNRAALVSFQDRDHGDGGGDLRGWAAARLAEAGLAGPWGAIQVLCMPRVLGYVFNPLSIYFCHDMQDRLAGVVYEVNNTFGERHAYAMAAQESAHGVRQECAKAFYVSPFMPMGLRYRFRIAPPSEAVCVEIVANDGDDPVLRARFAGERRALDDRSLGRLLVELPFLTLKVIWAIHWEGLRLWLRGAPFTPRPRLSPANDARPPNPVENPALGAEPAKTGAAGLRLR